MHKIKSIKYVLLFFITTTACNQLNKMPTAKKEGLTTGVVAHRGAWKKNNLPENSIASLKNAIALQCAGSEFDVRMTADDSLIINHDPTYNGLEIEKTTFKELTKHVLSNGEPLPTLRNYLLAGMEHRMLTKIICEIKPSGISKERGQLIAERVLLMVNTLDIKNNIEYISFDYDILKKIVAIDATAKTQYLEGNKTPVQLKADGITGADYYYTVFKEHPDWITMAKENSITLNAWTVNDPKVMDWLIENNFEFITTNEPELLMERISLLKK